MPCGIFHDIFHSQPWNCPFDRGPGLLQTSAAHLTCRNRPQECSLINLNYSFPDSAAPRSVVNPGFWFKSSECRLFRQRGLLNASCQILTNLNTDATCIHHKALVGAPSYQCLANRPMVIMNNVELWNALPVFFSMSGCLNPSNKILSILGI